MNPVAGRIEDLRAAARARGVHDYLVPSTDEHLDEYLPAWRRRREWASGFTGSAGDLLVGESDAWLYADGRYHLQAEAELAGSGIRLMKVGAPGQRSLLSDIAERARSRPGLRLGVDPMVLPMAAAEAIEAALARHGGTLVRLSGHLVDPLWTDRPEPETSPLIEVPLEWAGLAPGAKLEAVRADLAAARARSLVILKLDQIAWLLNLRSRRDVPFNPVFESYLVLGPDFVELFLREPDRRLPPALRDRIPGLRVRPYAEFERTLSGIPGPALIDPLGTTAGVAEALRSAGVEIATAPSPIELRKAVKNEAEMRAMAEANRRASVAKTRALLWLRRELEAGTIVTERAFRERIEALYAEQPGYFDLSFETIAATGAHGAIVHYGAAGDTPLAEGELFLIDSGAHIAGGTTDDTRTVSVGRAGPEARRLHTLVLKGHIRAARQRIPDGSSGAVLDALARAPLWEAGENYDHGTGHGVGAFLNVHEGPFAISERTRKSVAEQPLRAGYVTSIEPGVYVPGMGGVRLENLYLLRGEGPDAQGRRWLVLEPLTFVPFDSELIEDGLLEPMERAWLADYHARCKAVLLPLLPERERYELQAWMG
jgi:Xaa-Pro aminopeptidase